MSVNRCKTDFKRGKCSFLGRQGKS